MPLITQLGAATRCFGGATSTLNKLKVPDHGTQVNYNVPGGTIKIVLRRGGANKLPSAFAGTKTIFQVPTYGTLKINYMVPAKAQQKQYHVQASTLTNCGACTYLTSSTCLQRHANVRCASAKALGSRHHAAGTLIIYISHPQRSKMGSICAIRQVKNNYILHRGRQGKGVAHQSNLCHHGTRECAARRTVLPPIARCKAHHGQRAKMHGNNYNSEQHEPSPLRSNAHAYTYMPKCTARTPHTNPVVPLGFSTPRVISLGANPHHLVPIELVGMTCCHARKIPVKAYATTN